MTTGALMFMGLAWALVLGLLVWSYWRLLRLPPGGEPPAGSDR